MVRLLYSIHHPKHGLPQHVTYLLTHWLSREGDTWIDDLTELAAFYHRDKLDHTLNYPLEFVSSQEGLTTDSFDYFPEHHYRQGFEELRDRVSDDTLDEWMNQVIGHTPMGASHGGLWRDEIPQVVSDILSSNHRYETEITIKPEPRPDGYEYTVEWKRVGFDKDVMEWKPVNEFRENEG